MIKRPFRDTKKRMISALTDRQLCTAPAPSQVTVQSGSRQYSDPNVL